MKFIAVSLIGIPAAGKTTFAHRLIELSKRNDLSASVILVTFDDYIKMDFNKLAGEYKAFREKLQLKIEGLLRLLMSSEQLRWTEILSSHELKVHKDNFNLKQSLTTLFILDDNMYFRSMRQRIRAMCKKLQCQHFQIFMKSSFDEATKRNKDRSSSEQVPESVIEKMLRKIETPRNLRTIVIEHGQDDETLIALLHKRIEDPERTEEPAEHQKSQQQQSIIHDVDIITRRELNKKIKTIESTDFTSVCAALNQCRKEFLEDLKDKDLFSVEVDSLITAFRCILDQQTVNFTSNKLSN